MIDILMNLKFKFMKVNLKQFELPVYVTLAEKLHLRALVQIQNRTQLHNWSNVYCA